MKFKLDIAALRAYWERLPKYVRSVINVVAGAVIAAVLTFLVEGLSAGEIDVNELVQVILTAVGTALARALNPADASYGFGTESPSNDVDLEGDHEAIDWDTL